jgi:hypothetical protein
LGAQSCLWLSLRTSISKKLHLGPQNGPGSENLLKIVNCQNGQKTCFEPFGKGGWPPISTWIMFAPNSSLGEQIKGAYMPSWVLLGMTAVEERVREIKTKTINKN